MENEKESRKNDNQSTKNQHNSGDSNIQNDTKNSLNKSTPNINNQPPENLPNSNTYNNDFDNSKKNVQQQNAFDKGPNNTSEAFQNTSSMNEKPTNIANSMNDVKNIRANSQQANEQSAEQNIADVAIDTIKTLPQATAHLAEQNYIGLTSDITGYASRSGGKILKILLIVIIGVIVFFCAIFASMKQLPSLIFSDFINNIKVSYSEHQLSIAKQAMYNAYEDVVSSTVSNIVKDTKNILNIGSFTSWKKIVTGQDNGFIVKTEKYGEKDSKISITEKVTGNTITILFKNAYGFIDDFSSVQVDDIALLNAFSYYNMYKDNEKYINGEAIDIPIEEDNNEKNSWKSKDTNAFKIWIREREKSLISYNLVASIDTPSENVKIKNYILEVSSVCSEEQINQLFGFSDAQKEKVKELNKYGNIYKSVSEDVLNEKTKFDNERIFPFIDIYTNLFPNDVNYPLPKNYHGINAKDDGRTNDEIINRVVSKALEEELYQGFLTEEDYKNGNHKNSGYFTKYGEWYGENNTLWNTIFLSWVYNEVDFSLNQETKLLNTAFPRTNSASVAAEFLINNGKWHFPIENNNLTIPKIGDVIFLRYDANSGEPLINTCPAINPNYANVIVNTIGIVLETDDNTVTMIGVNELTSRVQKLKFSFDSEFISGYATPNYSAVTGKESETIVNSGFVSPINNEYTITASFPNYNNGSYHGGIDFAVPTGTPIIAANNGVVEFVNLIAFSYGKHIKITHANGISTLYAHCSNIIVNEGDTIQTGQIIGYSGNTGNSTGPHLHFEVRLNNQRVNPFDYITKGD